MAYSSLCIFKLSSAYLHLLCLPWPISCFKYSNCCGGAAVLSPPQLSQLQSSSYASKNHGEAPCPGLPIKDLLKEPKLHLVLTAVGRSGVSVLATSSCRGLFSSCNLDNWYWEHPATMKTRCIRRCVWLFVVKSTQGWLWSVQICQERFLVLTSLLLGVFPLHAMKNK